MKTNKENFLKLVSPDKSGTIEEIKERIANRYWLKYSQNIALNVLQQLDELKWSKETFAEKMNLSIVISMIIIFQSGLNYLLILIGLKID
jgi:hypothetical protein